MKAYNWTETFNFLFKRLQIRLYLPFLDIHLEKLSLGKKTVSKFLVCPIIINLLRAGTNVNQCVFNILTNYSAMPIAFTIMFVVAKWNTSIFSFSLLSWNRPNFTKNLKSFPSILKLSRGKYISLFSASILSSVM